MTVTTLDDTRRFQRRRDVAPRGDLRDEHGRRVPDTIEFAPELTAGGPATILLTQGELQITDSLTIDGPGAELLTIDAQQKSGIFSITFLAGDVTFSGMTLTGARIGGAIRTNTLGQLTLDHMTVRDNSAVGSGGGIYGRNVTLIHCTVSGNSTTGANAHGGGIHASYLTLIESNVSGNSTAGNAAQGGGIHAHVATLSNSIISGNQTKGRSAKGGGIFVTYRGEFTRCVVVGNSTTGNSAYGGGIAIEGYPFLSPSGIVLTESAVIGNSTNGAAPTVEASGSLLALCR